MKTAALLGAVLGMSAAAVSAADLSLESPKDRTSYAIGYDMVRNFRKQEVDFSADALMRGIQDAVANAAPQVSEREMRALISGLQADVRQKMTLARRSAAAENRQRGQAWLDANKGKEGVVTLASGLQYRVLQAGAAGGRHPVESDMVECLYRGTLIDGTEFDATAPGKPVTLKLSALIPGWREALKLMTPGARWQLFVPAGLAYGERGAGNEIGPNEALQFEVELVGIK
jgi:FKBP-type peptidyl-prolyl cis-trans isomerase FklB